MTDLQLPAVPAKPDQYELVVIHDNIAYLSGQVSRTPDGGIIAGHLARDDDIDDARTAVRVATLRALAILKDRLGSFERVAQVLTLKGYISAAPDFARHPQVLDAASELLRETFGERGNHVRTALGVASIPGGGLAELELVVAIR